MAIGIVGRPELLFLDEPTAGFDPEARRDFHDLVHRLPDRDEATILLTTHDLDEAEKLADRILILAGGQIIADGSADELSRRMSTQAEVRWSRDGQRFIHPADEPTRFVRDLFRQYGESIEDLEVRRASLEDTYMTLVRQAESGIRAGNRGRAHALGGGRMNASWAAARLGIRRGLIELKQTFTNSDTLLPTLIVTGAFLVVMLLTRNTKVPGTSFSLGTAILPSVLGMGIGVNGLASMAGMLAAEREDGTLLRAKATPHGMTGFLVGKIVTVAGTVLIGVAGTLILGIFIFHGLALGRPRPG